MNTNKKMVRINLSNAEATLALGAKLAHVFKQPFVIFLSGDLGAGKTTFVQGFLKGLGYKGIVKSPTYTLVENYEIADKQIFHFDLYRLANPGELEFIGIHDYFTQAAINLVEWPERSAGIIPDADLAIRLDMIEQGREATIIANTVQGENILKEFH